MAATALLIVNLGSPAAPTAAALRPYLKEFLSDRRVIDLPRWWWQPLLHLWVLNTRPRRSARAYGRIWGPDGSPLLSITAAQSTALGERFPELTVAYAMRYGQPTLASRLRELRAAGVQRILIVPMYPQYSDTTTATIVDAVGAALAGLHGLPEIRYVPAWYEHPLYIAALRQSVENYVARHGRPEKILLSYHGIPRRYAERGDPYPQQCERTTALLRAALPELELQTVYQSRFGREEWLRPYADETIAALGRAGCTHLAVLCPGFAADCLETLEEMAEENRERFQSAGGGRYGYIPALNSDAPHLELLSSLIREQLWPHPAF